ncbi:hypothetical protein VTO73DRAFT_6479 [Trametes versicolor]
MPTRASLQRAEQSTLPAHAGQSTLPTQQTPQPEYVADNTAWGRLVPCSPEMTGHKFDKAQRTYRIGAGARSEVDEPFDIVLPKTGSLNCLIEWDGNESAAKIVDMSVDGAGVFLNSCRCTPGQFYVLRGGCEITFAIQKSKKGKGVGEVHSDGYRFIYLHMVPSPPVHGVHEFYDFDRELGKGTFATVHKALNKAEGRWYAVKVIHTHKLNLPPGWSKELQHGPPVDRAVKKLMAEILILERLNHRNICQLREVFAEPHRLSLVLELVEGGDLQTYLLQNKKALTETETGRILYQLCDALAYVHEQKIAHRDLKLENVLLTLDDPPVVKVVDFGLAKAISTLSDLQRLCGTPTYLAPEIARDDRDSNRYTVVVDSWSVGIIAFMMLTYERRPYVKGTTGADIKTQVTTRRINWELLQSCGVSRQCESFLRGLLEYDPSRRTTMADALRDPWLRAYAPNASSPAWEDGSPAPAIVVSVPTPSPGRRSTLYADVTCSAPPRASGKRKAQDRSDMSLSLTAKLEIPGERSVVATFTATATLERAKSSRGGKKPAARAPAKKKARIGSASDTIAFIRDDPEEVPERVLPRRSPRLNPPPP